MKNRFLLFLMLNSSFLFAQQTGQIDYPSLGIAFTVPDGWVGQETEDYFLMGSNTIPGLLMIAPSEVSTIDEMRIEARKGIYDHSGTALEFKGDIETLDATMIGGLLEGTLEGQQAKGYIIGKANTYGKGVNILAITLTNLYTQDHKDVALTLAKSVRFSKPVVSDEIKEWREYLKNTRLTYMKSSYSNDGAYGDTGYTMGGGSSTKKVLDLCGAGYYNYSSSNSMSFDVGGGFGSANGSDQGAGTWKIISNASGQAVLQLNAHDGDVYEFVITYEDSKTFLNGTRYFVTTGAYANDGPSCN